jgi:hypothetical protein
MTDINLCEDFTKDGWFGAHIKPTVIGYYLVIQKRIERNRWVRFWNGSQWVNIKEDKYGPIFYWSHLKEYPK